MSSVAIIGGGIAGLSACISLHRFGVEPRVYERSSEWARRGHGFILLGNGLDALDHLGLRQAVCMRGHAVDCFVMRSSQGRVLTKLPLADAVGIQRRYFVEALRGAVPDSAIAMGMRFNGFDWSPEGRVECARFERHESVDAGDRSESSVLVEADWFIGADGVRSRTRAELFPDHMVSKVRVKELVCSVHAPDLAAQMGNMFLKTQDEHTGLALGIVPCGGGDLVWYLQYDSERLDMDEPTIGADAGARHPSNECKQAFARALVSGWPAPIPELLERTNFEEAHVWSTTDMELLPSFHRKNVVLIGDAAHVFLTFTSQGVNSALQDVVTLARCLATRRTCRVFAVAASEDGSGRSPSPIADDAVLEQFSTERRSEVGGFIDAGRSLAERFLYPSRFAGDIAVPLVK